MSRWFAFLLAALLAGCATGPVPLDRSFSAVSQDSRVRYLILHYTAIDSALSLKVLTQQAVSSHYLIDDGEEAKVYMLVDESRRAYHAGVSYWKGATNLNASSIGIEIVNLGFRNTEAGRQWVPFTPKQTERIVALVRDITQRHGISPDRVLGHSDIAPQRKQDPGPLFPWKALADAGLVLWPDANQAALARSQFDIVLPDVVWFQTKLAAHGFEVPRSGVMDEATRVVLSAFQMKYRPANHAGEMDAETAALLEALTAPLNVPVLVPRALASSRQESTPR